MKSNHNDKAWQEMFTQLQAFKAQHGHCNVSKEKMVGGKISPHYQLGAWCTTQRQLAKSDRLILGRREALAKVGFSFDPANEAWQDMFDQLQTFKAKYGHCEVSAKKMAGDQPNPYWKLGEWCNSQRQAEKNGALNPSRREALNQMGLSFYTQDDAWQDMFDQLQTFKAQYGHCNVPTQPTVGGQPNPYWKLGAWCSNQRSRAEIIAPERKEALVNIGFSFSPQEDSWQEMFAKLQAFKSQYGHCEVSAKKMTGDRPNPHYQLGVWCNYQFGLQKNKKLTLERKDALAKVGFFDRQPPAANVNLPSVKKEKSPFIAKQPRAAKVKPSSPPDAWQEMFAQLQAFKAKHGHCNVSGMKVLGGQPNPDWQLGAWCGTQLQADKHKRINLEKRELLSKLGFSFRHADEAWEEMFARLKSFHAEHGHFIIPGEKIVRGRSNPHWQLGKWCFNQCRAARNNTLTPERAEALAKIGFSVGPHSDVWQGKYIELQAFKAQYGHCNVPTTKTVDGQPNPHYELGMWCVAQRKAAKIDALTAQRTEMLNEVGLSFDTRDDEWHEMFAQLQVFHARFGHCNVWSEKTFKGHPYPHWQLGQWCSDQRHNNALTSDQVKMLAAMGLEVNCVATPASAKDALVAYAKATRDRRTDAFDDDDPERGRMRG